LICGALTWLRDHKAKTFEEGLNWGNGDQSILADTNTSLTSGQTQMNQDGSSNKPKHEDAENFSVIEKIWKQD